MIMQEQLQPTNVKILKALKYQLMLLLMVIFRITKNSHKNAKVPLLIFLKNQLKKDKVTANVKTKYTAEDWEGFQKLMEKSSIQDKELILRVLSMYSDPEVREREIRNLSQAFAAVADEIMPQLRRAKFIATVDLIGKTDEELLAAAQNDPKSLNQAELLHAATLNR
jgi:hypothetical protein